MYCTSESPWFVHADTIWFQSGYCIILYYVTFSISLSLPPSKIRIFLSTPCSQTHLLSLSLSLFLLFNWLSEETEPTLFFSSICYKVCPNVCRVCQSSLVRSAFVLCHLVGKPFVHKLGTDSSSGRLLEHPLLSSRIVCCVLSYC
jgi:hypothetical protein